MHTLKKILLGYLTECLKLQYLIIKQIKAVHNVLGVGNWAIKLLRKHSVDKVSLMQIKIK